MREGMCGENQELEVGMGEGMGGCRTSLRHPGKVRKRGRRWKEPELSIWVPTSLSCQVSSGRLLTQLRGPHWLDQESLGLPQPDDSETL